MFTYLGETISICQRNKEEDLLFTFLQVAYTIGGLEIVSNTVHGTKPR